jgi:probable rRNA maturation factor
MPFTLVNETATAVPKADFASIARFILGKKYTLNLVVTDSARIKKLNTVYRDQTRATDILSFPLSETEGEIYISPVEAAAEAHKFSRSYENFFVFLFIHGCVHLKGHDHGAIMERMEAKAREKFGI